LKIIVDPNYNLGKLQKWLTFELSGPIILYLTYIFPLAFLFAIVAALAFVPLLFKVLIMERKYGWLMSFFIIVVGSGFVTYAFLKQADWMWHDTVISSSAMVSLVFFYFYCGLLKLIIPRWFHDEEFDAA